MTTSAADRLGNHLYRKIVIPKIGTFRIAKILQGRITDDKDGISNTKYGIDLPRDIDANTDHCPSVVWKVNKGIRNELQTDAMRENLVYREVIKIAEIWKL